MTYSSHYPPSSLKGCIRQFIYQDHDILDSTSRHQTTDGTIPATTTHLPSPVLSSHLSSILLQEAKHFLHTWAPSSSHDTFPALLQLAQTPGRTPGLLLLHHRQEKDPPPWSSPRTTHGTVHRSPRSPTTTTPTSLASPQMRQYRTQL